MTTVWQTRYRLLHQQLKQWADGLRDTQPPAVLAEPTVRLLTFALMLLAQHHINKRGRCRYCGWARWRWRFWHPRPQCTVCRTLAFALGQSVDVVWWQLLTIMGEKTSLADVRKWTTKQDRDSAPHEPAIRTEEVDE